MIWVFKNSEHLVIYVSIFIIHSLIKISMRSSDELVEDHS